MVRSLRLLGVVLMVLVCGSAPEMVRAQPSGVSNVKAAGYHYEYYRDVYANGKWGWSNHGYPSYSRAQEEARRACRVGSPVQYIGKFDSRGNLIEKWRYRC